MAVVCVEEKAEAMRDILVKEKWVRALQELDDAIVAQELILE